MRARSNSEMIHPGYLLGTEELDLIKKVVGGGMKIGVVGVRTARPRKGTSRGQGRPTTKIRVRRGLLGENRILISGLVSLFTALLVVQVHILMALGK